MTLALATTAHPTFAAPTVASGSPAAVLVFSLVVSDPNASSSPSTVTVRVSPAPPANPPPVASAGSNLAVASGAAVTLDGSGSHDPDLQPLSYAWTQTSGPAVTLSLATTAQPTFTAPTVASGSAPDTLVFSLVVSDANASSAPSTVTVTVNPASGTINPPPPGTPPPAVAGTPLPTGGSGSHRFQMGTDLSTGGLTVVDPLAGEPSVVGFVVVSFVSAGAPAPADAVVTLNGAPLTRVSGPGSNGLFWQLSPPPATQPTVGSGGEIVLVATATDPSTSRTIQRTLVLPCPADIPVTLTPGVGSPLVTGSSLNLSSSADILFNAGVPLFQAYGPTAMLWGYEPATRTHLGYGSAKVIGTPSGFNVDVPVCQGAGAPCVATTAGAYLLDLRWPGPGILDGETGGYCQLAKRFFFTK